MSNDQSRSVYWFLSYGSLSPAQIVEVRPTNRELCVFG